MLQVNDGIRRKLADKESDDKAVFIRDTIFKADANDLGNEQKRLVSCFRVSLRLKTQARQAKVDAQLNTLSEECRRLTCEKIFQEAKLYGVKIVNT